MYVASLKVEYLQSPRNYKLILQDIAAEVNNNIPSGNAFGGQRGVSATYTKKGPCPNSGVHTNDGSVFIGTYSKDQWTSDAVKPHWDEIKKARLESKGDGSQPSRSGKRRINAIKREKKKLKKLKAQVAAIQQTTASNDDEATDADTDNDNPDNNAGNAFGGKRTKAKKD